MEQAPAIDYRKDAAAGRKFDLQERLLAFAVAIIKLSDACHKTQAGLHVADQLLRAGTSPLFNHGEAEAAESPRDFVHKLKICLKELRETQRALLLVQRVPLVADVATVTPLLGETDELIRIFVASIRTAKKNMLQEDSGAGSAHDPAE
jgi:four helix bundle protein